VKRRLWAACLLGGLLLAACAPSDAVRVGRQIGAALYLPTSLPSGMRLASVQRIGPHMAFLSYRGGRGAMSIFESPQPIAPPPGATRDKHGVWRAAAVVGGQPQLSALMRLHGEFVEVIAVGVGEDGLAQLMQNWQRVGP